MRDLGAHSSKPNWGPCLDDKFYCLIPLKGKIHNSLWPLTWEAGQDPAMRRCTCGPAPCPRKVNCLGYVSALDQNMFLCTALHEVTRNHEPEGLHHNSSCLEMAEERGRSLWHSLFSSKPALFLASPVCQATRWAISVNTGMMAKQAAVWSPCPDPFLLLH